LSDISYKMRYLCSKLDFVNSFFLLWSDTGIKRFHKKLDAGLTNFGEFSEDNPYYRMTAQYSGAKPFNPPLLQRGFMRAATYLFGRYRLQSDIGNDEVAQSAIEFLIRNQASDWSWWKDNTSSGNIILTSAALHALVLTEPFRAKRHIERAKDFLIKMQDSDGSWAKTERYDAVYSTVFVLDALELAGGGTQVTFKISVPEIQTTESTAQISPINNQVFNITSEHLDIKIEGKSTKNAKQTSSNRNNKKAQVTATTPQRDEKNTHFVKELSETAIVIENNGGITIYKSGSPTKAKTVKSKLTLRLLGYIADKRSIPSSIVRDAAGSMSRKENSKGRKPREIIRDINKTLVLILKNNLITGFSDLPNDFEIINNDDDENIYESLIYVITRETFNQKQRKPKQQDCSQVDSLSDVSNKYDSLDE